MMMHGWAGEVAPSPEEFCTGAHYTGAPERVRGITYRDAIAADVQILGGGMDGPGRAKCSIQAHDIISLIIIISGVIRPEYVKRKHGDVSYGYLCKDNCGEELPRVLKAACSPLWTVEMPAQDAHRICQAFPNTCQIGHDAVRFDWHVAGSVWERPSRTPAAGSGLATSLAPDIDMNDITRTCTSGRPASRTYPYRRQNLKMSELENVPVWRS